MIRRVAIATFQLTVCSTLRYMSKKIHLKYFKYLAGISIQIIKSKELD